MAAQLVKDPISCDLLMNEVGLADRKNNFPAQLSGGEQQRVSIARAIAKNPKLLLCDEPTGALDYQTGKAILKLLQSLSTEKGMTVVIITHNSALTEMADRVIRVKNGKITSMIVNEHPVSVDTIEW
jgi:putative ABC transport system ATP-binding protein